MQVSIGVDNVFNIARKEWGMESLSTPVELVRKPQPNNARTRRISAENSPGNAPVEDDARSDRGANDGELKWVLAASGSTLLPPIMCLAIETAMRRGEIIALRWENVDLKRRVAHLPATKNGSSRDVPLSSRAVATLQGLLTAGNETGKGSQDGDSLDTGRVFNIRGDAVTRAFERAVARASSMSTSARKPSDGRTIGF